MKCTQRLYLTKDSKKVVPDGHPKAAILYAVPGDEIPASAVELFGLVDGGLKGGSKEDQGGGDKEKAPGGDKEKQPGDDKGNGSQGGGPPRPNKLADLKGVGDKTAAALTAAGYTSFASIAAIDPANPPTIEGIGKLFKWPDVIADAKAKAPAVEPVS